MHFVVALVLVVVGIVEGNIDAAEKCQVVYSQSAQPGTECEFLQQFDICITNALEESDNIDRVNKLLAFSLETYFFKGCSYQSVGPNQIKRENGNLAVHTAADFRVKRDVTTVSLWSLYEDLMAVKTKAAQLVTQADLPTTFLTKDSVTNVQNQLYLTKTDVRALVQQALSASLDNIKQTLLSESQAFNNVYKPVVTSLQALSVNKDNLNQLTQSHGAVFDEIRTIIENYEISKPDEIAAQRKVYEDLLVKKTAELQSVINELNQKKTELTNTFNTVKSRLVTKIATANTQLSALQTLAGNTVTAANNNAAQVTSIRSGFINKKAIFYSGYCSSHGTAGGWVNYCTNSVDFYNGGGYFTLCNQGAGIFCVQKAGYYRINYWGLTCCGSSHSHQQLIVDGTCRAYGHTYLSGNWHTNILDQTWYMNAGSQFFLQLYNPNSYAYHSGNPNGHHSRIQVTFVGEQ